MKLGVICEFGDKCILIREDLHPGTRVCGGSHTFSDYDPKYQHLYTNVIEVSDFMKGKLGGNK